jgi:hypothetical protein
MARIKRKKGRRGARNAGSDIAHSEPPVGGPPRNLRNQNTDAPAGVAVGEKTAPLEPLSRDINWQVDFTWRSTLLKSDEDYPGSSPGSSKIDLSPMWRHPTTFPPIIRRVGQSAGA